MSYFKSQRKILLKCYSKYASKFGKPNSVHRTGKGQFSLQSQRGAMPKNGQTAIQSCSFCMLARLCSKILQARLQHEPRTSRCTNWVLMRQRNQRSNCQHSRHQEGKGVSEKYLLLFHYAQVFDFVDHYKLQQILRFGNTRPPYLSLRNLYACQE